MRRPERICGNEATTELEGLIQRAGHLLAGFVVRAHVFYAGQQLVEALPQEHLGPGTLGRRAARAV